MKFLAKRERTHSQANTQLNYSDKQITLRLVTKVSKLIESVSPNYNYNGSKKNKGYTSSAKIHG